MPPRRGGRAQRRTRARTSPSFSQIPTLDARSRRGEPHAGERTAGSGTSAADPNGANPNATDRTDQPNHQSDATPVDARPNSTRKSCVIDPSAARQRRVDAGPATTFSPLTATYRRRPSYRPTRSWRNTRSRPRPATTGIPSWRASSAARTARGRGANEGRATWSVRGARRDGRGLRARGGVSTVRVAGDGVGLGDRLASNVKHDPACGCPWSVPSGGVGFHAARGASEIAPDAARPAPSVPCHRNPDHGDTSWARPSPSPAASAPSSTRTP